MNWAAFDDQFAALTGFKPLDWQRRLFSWLIDGRVPSSIDLPTGLGKTSVMAIWLIAKAQGAGLPRRLVYVVDRRAVVDQATDEAEMLRSALQGAAPHLEKLDGVKRASAEQTVSELTKRLGLLDGRPLPISTLRGAYVDNREWLNDPSAPTIIIGTVDMVGSRLLFQGYGVSRRMRPYHAGLLGGDALVVLDEAHLVPPFAHLLRAIEQETSFRPRKEADRKLVPAFVVLPLSATQRDRNPNRGGRLPFELEEADRRTDSVARMRIEAPKKLQLVQLAENNRERQLAEVALALATGSGGPFRVAVFCDRRDKDDSALGPSVQGIKEEIEKLARGDRGEGSEKLDIHPPELVVGARRVHERDDAARQLRALGFIGKKKSLDKPAFLLATAAGEVGIDIDADHMVSDLVAWERMVQRLGRVNRRGTGEAEIRVFWSEPTVNNSDAPSDAEKRASVGFACKAVIETLRGVDGAYDASPGSLRRLTTCAGDNPRIEVLVRQATTPEPVRPAVNRALVDAWSMTSLESHTGRPDVAPWLRGWVDEPQQTTLIWRTHLPVRLDSDGRTIPVGKQEIAAFFEAAPPRESEKLDTESFRVATWLQERARTLIRGKLSSSEQPSAADDGVEPTASMDGNAELDNDDEPSTLPGLEPSDIVALLLAPNGVTGGHWTLEELARERKGRARRDLHAKLSSSTVVVDARFGGLSRGLLDASSDEPVETADATGSWSKQALFRVRRYRPATNDESLQQDREGRWRFEADFNLRLDDNGMPIQCLRIEHFREVAQREDARSISRPQELVEHQEWTRRAALRIARLHDLPAPAASALAVAAGLHDEGKKASSWQRAFKAPRDQKRFGLAGPLAKTLGPLDLDILGGYRHELGSLPYVERNREFKALPDDWQDLVLHLVAAHHGQARPVIETQGCEDAPPSSLAKRAQAVAERFARLQQRWGPWGLAWWETLLRAADQQASRDNERADRSPNPEGG